MLRKVHSYVLHSWIIENLATRIKGRATQRMGQLAKEILASQGGRPPNETSEGGHTSLGRYETMRQAGVTDHQTKQAIRVANVPSQEFETTKPARKQAMKYSFGCTGFLFRGTNDLNDKRPH